MASSTRVLTHYLALKESLRVSENFVISGSYLAPGMMSGLINKVLIKKHIRDMYM